MSRLIYYGVTLIIYLVLLKLLQYAYAWVPFNTTFNVMALLFAILLIPVALVCSKHLLDFIKSRY